MTRVGWIGLGAMGAPMAVCLARADFEVTGYDVDAGRAAGLADDGVLAARSSAGAADGVDVLAVMVATPEQVETVLFGDDAASALRPGATVLVLATVGPAAVQGWAERLAARRVDLVDAPVSGGVARAADGELLVMAGGAPPAVQRVRPVLDALARTVAVVGDAPGDGQKVKLVNQLLCGVHIAAAAEALALADSLGLDVAATWEVVRGGAAASFMLDDRGSRMVHGTDEVRSALDIFVKDMGLVTDAGRAGGQPTPLAATVEQLYLAGRRAGLGQHDDSVLLDVLRGTTPRGGPPPRG